MSNQNKPQKKCRLDVLDTAHQSSSLVIETKTENNIFKRKSSNQKAQFLALNCFRCF